MPFILVRSFQFRSTLWNLVLGRQPFQESRVLLHSFIQLVIKHPHYVVGSDSCDSSAVQRLQHNIADSFLARQPQPPNPLD
jgi:hypothetical protein